MHAMVKLLLLNLVASDSQDRFVYYLYKKFQGRQSFRGVNITL